MLLDIRDTVADYAELIARVVGVDVEVVDAGLNRLAGTGLYASGVGENIRAEGETYRHVMRIRRSFVMETPREHFICTRCPGRDLCRETLSISTPIIDGSDDLVVMVIASNGYPENVIKGARVPEIEVDEDSHVYYAGVASDEHGNLVANSGRVLLVETSAPDIKSAQDKVYAIIDKLERGYRARFFCPGSRFRLFFANQDS